MKTPSSLFKFCKVCGTKFYKPYTCSLREWEEKRKFCSRKCCDSVRTSDHLRQYDFKKGVRSNPSGEFKVGQTIASKNVNWKGDEASYFAIHLWLKRWHPKKGTCEKCGAKRLTHYANLSGKYRRDRSDYLELCVPCHKRMDLARNRGKSVN